MHSLLPLVLITCANDNSARDLQKTFPKLQPDNFAVGDFLEQHTVDLAMKGVNMVIHIGPPMHPQEAACGTIVIDAARRHNVGHFILSSVLHPLRQKMLNHKVKLEVEEYLIESGLPWTILQPTHMMQNMALKPIFSTGVITMPYSPATVQGFIDLTDFAQVVLKVVQSPEEHNMARYELLGCVGSYNEVADTIGRKIGKPVKVERIPAEQAIARMGTHPYTQEAMKRMLYYYDTRGLTGNPNILRWLLGREPCTWDDYLDRVLRK
ncbi:NAD-P-binding protein [Calocera viscosa TUFC12733]|uniref:NAD-P-binding protein n=1 Tax=Calocera viscosa (strain TUFC12733) TaxID=1330018 RepID=A0A167KTR5_CALVF|nr:NAD-P-binding protein [Calocera viscosa TUFC12733]